VAIHYEMLSWSLRFSAPPWASSRFKLFARRFWHDAFLRIPIERGVVVMYENARPKRPVRYWVVSIVILGALGVVGWYAVSVFARLLFPS
jgi:hypothetical protein